MALLKCSECAGAMSSEASACPHCGKPNFVGAAPVVSAQQAPRRSSRLAPDVGVWSGRTSQWVNFGVYFVCACLFFLVVPILFALWRYFVVKNQRYELTDQRLRMYRGVLSRRVDEVELYRVKDNRFEQPFLLRLMGLGNVVLVASDALNPNMIIVAVPDAREVREKMRNLVEARRDAKSVRMTELE